ncbi:hypothetical protein Tco_0187885 [Tanacetum coccineum]
MIGLLNKKGSSSGGHLLSEEPLASFYSHIRCAGSLGEKKQASPAYLPSISIGGNGFTLMYARGTSSIEEPV